MSRANDIFGSDGYSVEIAAQWALHGKQSSDAGYRLLSSSKSVLSPDNFSYILERYSPGTIERLPQLTVNWFEDKNPRHGHHAKYEQPANYVGIAIHDRPAAGIVDAGGREIVETRYFCADYDTLAGSTISYSSMYEGFRTIKLPMHDADCVKAALSIRPPSVPARSLATVAAALLLTDRPVCVLGAGLVDVGERLRFIDDVASLLPYGMRSHLSAATWTDSTHRSHNFRLFFSSASRSAEDHKIDWYLTQRLTSTGFGESDQYLIWLNGDLAARTKMLAEMTDPMSFSRDYIMAMLDALGVTPHRRALMAGSSPVGPAQAIPDLGDTTQVGTPSIEDLLLDCATCLNGQQPQSVERYLPNLEQHLAEQLKSQERRKYIELVKRHSLLRENLGIDRRVRASFYSVLLRLLFEVPIKYNSYCTMEECAGGEGGPQVHRPLAEALLGVRCTTVVRFLALRTKSDADLRSAVHRTRLDLTEVIDLIVPALKVAHADVICDVALEHIESYAQVYGQDAIKETFESHVYLAEILHRIYRSQGPTELNMLVRILQVTYGAALSPSAVADIMDTLDNTNTDPTAALCAAIIVLASDPGSIGEVVRRGFGAYIKDRSFSASAESVVMTRLAEVMGTESKDDAPARSIWRKLMWWSSQELFTWIGLGLILGLVILIFAKILYK